MSSLLLISLLAFCVFAIPPPSPAASLAPPLPLNLTTTVAGRPFGPLPPPQCFAGLRILTKPVLHAQNCEPIFEWFRTKGIFRSVLLRQDDLREIHTFPPPEAGIGHDGCEIEVYSRTVSAVASLTYSDIQQAAKHIINECAQVRFGGRGGKSAILSPPNGILQGWYVKVEAKVNVDV